MNKIIEKAHWEGLITLEDEKTPQASFGQPVCYNCNQVIPANSTFCPYCQINLFVTCPKCGNRYSSQYPSCNQCGTNLKVYMREQERLREQRLEKQRQEEERKRIEEERRRRLELEREREEQRRIEALVERFSIENREIVKTPEFKETERLLNEFDVYFKRKSKTVYYPNIVGIILLIPTIVGMTLYNEFVFVLLLPILMFIIILIYYLIAQSIDRRRSDIKRQFSKFIKSQIITKDIAPIINVIKSSLVNGYTVCKDPKKLIILSYRQAFNKEYALYRTICNRL